MLYVISSWETTSSLCYLLGAASRCVTPLFRTRMAVCDIPAEAQGSGQIFPDGLSFELGWGRD